MNTGQLSGICPTASKNTLDSLPEQVSLGWEKSMGVSVGIWPQGSMGWWGERAPGGEKGAKKGVAGSSDNELPLLHSSDWPGYAVYAYLSSFTR